MTMTDAEIGHARSARSSDTKAAIEYLRASGATAIIIIEIDGIWRGRSSNRPATMQAAARVARRACRYHARGDEQEGPASRI